MTVAFNYLGKLGQLGNQMFQYAATLGVARYTGVAFTIPNHKEIFDDGIGNKLRIELFDCFDIKPDNTGLLRTDYVVQEKGFEFDKTILHSSRTVDYTLYGFFQTEKYFKHCAKEIRKNFTFKDSIIKESQYVVDEFYDNPIGLHIRRGDFLTNSGNHHNLSLEYYQKALTHFKFTRNVLYSLMIQSGVRNSHYFLMIGSSFQRVIVHSMTYTLCLSVMISSLQTLLSLGGVLGYLIIQIRKLLLLESGLVLTMHT